MGYFDVALAQKANLSRRRATPQKVATRHDILILAWVLKQKLARKAGRHASAKLISKTRRAKVTKTQCESLKTNDLTLLKSFAEFRCNIRNVARGMKKSEEKFELLDLCDHIRDDVFPKHGYQLRDDGNDEFTIRKL